MSDIEGYLIMFNKETHCADDDEVKFMWRTLVSLFEIFDAGFFIICLPYGVLKESDYQCLKIVIEQVDIIWKCYLI